MPERPVPGVVALRAVEGEQRHPVLHLVEAEIVAHRSTPVRTRGPASSVRSSAAPGAASREGSRLRHRGPSPGRRASLSQAPVRVLVVARLGATERAGLPDRAFAYVDSRGRRRLPIHDPAHVRNALSRFGQVAFEDEAARDRARTRLLQAAKKYKIVPVGFIAGQLQSERALGESAATARSRCPRGSSRC